MSTADYTTTLLADQTPETVFNAINNVAAWWSANLEGHSEKTDDIFTVRFGETSITIKVAELDPYKKISWKVIDCYKHWLKNKEEWKGTTMHWNISATENATQIAFTHIGLVPGIECYNGCEKAWNFYLKESLLKLLADGKGIPEKKL